MRRRSRAGGKSVKPRRRETAAPERRNAPKAKRRRSSVTPDKKTNMTQLAHELKDAREQQMATAEILYVIRASPNDAQPVFETIVRNAVSLCGSLFANVFRFVGERLRFFACH